MATNVDTSIQSLCRAHWGAHYCLLYRSKDDLASLLAQYFKYGLENNEFCIWVTADTVVERKAQKILLETMPNLDDYQTKGQIEFANSKEWYLRDGSFQSDPITKRWYDKLNNSMHQGYKGMRVSGDLGWHDLVAWQSLMDYEMRLNHIIPQARLIAICSYPLEKLTASKLIDILRHHQLAITKNNGEWHVFEALKTERAIDLISGADGNLAVKLQDQDVLNYPVLCSDSCNGCGLCADVCQTGLLYLENQKVAIRERGTCNWCTYCEIVCPTNAIACPFEITL